MKTSQIDNLSPVTRLSDVDGHTTSNHPSDCVVERPRLEAGVLPCRVKAPPPGLGGCAAETRPKIYRRTAPRTIVRKGYLELHQRSRQTQAVRLPCRLGSDLLPTQSARLIPRRRALLAGEHLTRETPQAQTLSPTPTIASATTRRLAWLLRAWPRMSW